MLEATATETTSEAALATGLSPVKLCSKCGEPGEFRKGHAQCKVCEKQYGRARYVEKRACFVAYREANRDRYRKLNIENARRKKVERHAEVDRLKGVPCVECGGTFPPYVMDFDHRDPSTKEHEINFLINKTTCPWQRILDEVAKCDVVCVCCHRMRTWESPKNALDNRRKLIISLKSVPCADCGVMFHYCQMDFDHVRGEKIECVPLLKNKAAILAEAAKCDVVCANCHRERSHKLPSSVRAGLPTNTVAPRPKRTVPAYRPWHVLVGAVTDETLALRFGISRASVCLYRMRVGIPSFRKTKQMNIKMESVHGG